MDKKLSVHWSRLHWYEGESQYQNGYYTNDSKEIVAALKALRDGGTMSPPGLRPKAPCMRAEDGGYFAASCEIASEEIDWGGFDAPIERPNTVRLGRALAGFDDAGFFVEVLGETLRLPHPVLIFEEEHADEKVVNSLVEEAFAEIRERCPGTMLALMLKHASRNYQQLLCCDQSPSPMQRSTSAALAARVELEQGVDVLCDELWFAGCAAEKMIRDDGWHEGDA